MAGFLERLKLIGKPGEEDYAEIDLGQFEDVGDSPHIMLRMAELSKIEMLPEVTQEIYAGNIVLVDISGMKRDRVALEKAIVDMKKAVDDVSGDIAGIGDDLIAVVPGGIRIDREKVIGGRD